MRLRVAIDIYDTPNAASLPPEDGNDHSRPYIAILFECCNVYARVYRRPEQGYYHGRCPKCLRTLHVRVGPDGSASRFFHAS